MLEHAHDDVVLPVAIQQAHPPFATFIDGAAGIIGGNGAVVEVQDAQVHPLQPHDAERVLQHQTRRPAPMLSRVKLA